MSKTSLKLSQDTCFPVPPSLVRNTTSILWTSIHLLTDIARGYTLIAKWQAFNRGKGQDRSPISKIHRKKKQKQKQNLSSSFVEGQFTSLKPFLENII